MSSNIYNIVYEKYVFCDSVGKRHFRNDNDPFRLRHAEK